METTLKSDREGALHLPPSILPGAEPLATYRVQERQGEIVISKESSRGASTQPCSAATPAQKALAFEQWVERLPQGAGLSDYAVSRESIYD